MTVAMSTWRRVAVVLNDGRSVDLIRACVDLTQAAAVLDSGSTLD